MREVIFGCGSQKSLIAVVHLADIQLKKSRGIPRKLVAKSPNLEVLATRQAFDADFNSYNVRIKTHGKLAEAIKQLPAQQAPGCTVTEKDGWIEFHCPAPPTGVDGVKEAVDRLSSLLHLPEIWRVHGEQYRHDRLSSETLFKAMVKFHASDVHMHPGATPTFRIDGMIRHSEMPDQLSAEQILHFLRDIAPEKDWKEFEEKKQCSFQFHQVGLGYARVSAFIKADTPHCTMRFLPEVIPSFEDLSIPRTTMEKLAQMHFGLVLVTGMTGSGKSTTVASLIDWINAHRSLHILTIEEPVEYVHQNKKAIVSQRDVGVDVGSFHEAVRAALRHDPDVIVIGEMRDPDTIRSAINAAATGHLVISTLHAGTASEVINRIVSFFDPVERDLVKLQLRDCVKVVICQRLLRRAGGGRVPALEMLFNDTKHIHDSILAGDTTNIRIGMQQTASDSFIFEEYLLNLANKGIIQWNEATANATDTSVFQQMVLGTYTIPSVETMKHHHAVGDS